jgi:hypothetical protein
LFRLQTHRCGRRCDGHLRHAVLHRWDAASDLGLVSHLSGPLCLEILKGYRASGGSAEVRT